MEAIGGNYVGQSNRKFHGALTCRRDSHPIPKGPGYVVTSVAMKQVPGYWAFSAMLKRPDSEKLEFQANVNNLLEPLLHRSAASQPLDSRRRRKRAIGINFRFK